MRWFVALYKPSGSGQVVGEEIEARSFDDAEARMREKADKLVALFERPDGTLVSIGATPVGLMGVVGLDGRAGA